METLIEERDAARTEDKLADAAPSAPASSSLQIGAAALLAGAALAAAELAAAVAAAHGAGR